jgi:hypothetical protein
MDDRDKHDLATELVDAYMLKGVDETRVSAAMVLAWIRTLPELTMNQVREAMQIHARDPDAKYPPTPADVLRIVQQRNGNAFPASDEAWSVALSAMDEDTSVVWCNEIAEAWGAAKPVMDAGDDVGARMAFRETYKRLVRKAVEEGRAARWWVTQGHDPQQRADAIRYAQARGLLTQTRAQEMLRYITGTAPSRDQGDVAQITGNVLPFAGMRERLAGLRAALVTDDGDEFMTPEKAAGIERRRKAAAAMTAGSEQQA